MQSEKFNSQLSPTTTIDTIQEWLVNQIGKQLGINTQTIKVNEPLTRYGLDSIDSVTIVGELEDWLSTELPPTILWDYPTIEKAAQYLVNEVGVLPAKITTLPTTVTNEPKAKAAKEKAWGGRWNKISGI